MKVAFALLGFSIAGTALAVGLIFAGNHLAGFWGSLAGGGIFLLLLTLGIGFVIDRSRYGGPDD